MQSFVSLAVWGSVAVMVAALVAGGLRRWRVAVTLARAVALASPVLLITMVFALIGLPLRTASPAMKAAVLARGISEVMNCGVLAIAAALPASWMWFFARSRIAQKFAAMKLNIDGMPLERSLQFAAIEKASAKTLDWAAGQSIPLQHIEPVVPFVESDFALHAWLFFENESQVARFQADGTCETVIARFRSDLAGAGYRSEWLPQVVCHFGSKEVVDRDYQGSYYNFLR